MNSPDSLFIHESAYVDHGATVGQGTKIWHFCHVLSGAVIGERCSLGQNVVVMGGVRIGNNVKVQNNVSIYEGVELEDDVFCGPSMVFTNVVNPRSHISRKNEYQRTLVKRGATIGANATIVCGATLGEYSFIGAGSVVTGNVDHYALIVGVPGRRVGWMCHCGVKLEAQRASPLRDTETPREADREDAETLKPSERSGMQTLTCSACGTRYESDGETIERVG
ncbi:MAG: acetyltransferase [Gemmatimonadota bacterium]|nr:acetyltransferase [Gemmatimonadota bacterium]